MKIAAFEVRPDEKTSFARWAKAYNVEVKEYSEIPSLENADLAAGCEGVTFLGQGKINRELLAEYKKLGVKCVSTRTIGSDHIDLEAARELGIHGLQRELRAGQRGRFHDHDDADVLTPV